MFFSREKVVIRNRAAHNISRKNIDPDALRVLYRLSDANFTAYLVGGSVRDLLMGRRPKDFDISTDALPGQIRKLFRNCYLVGRRFRLAHIRFGDKVVETSTFRKPPQADAADEGVPGGNCIVISSCKGNKEGADNCCPQNTCTGHLSTPQE